MQKTAPKRNKNFDLVSGASWLAFGNVFSRILGALYIIPWTIMIGQSATLANGLFNMGYTIYAAFLMIATAGVPTAISRLVARYNAQNQEQTSLTLLARSIRISIYTGLIIAAVMAGLSPFLAVGRTELIIVLFSLVPAILILPFVGVLRGFYQGSNMMKESAISQIVEQVVRIVYILGATLYVLKNNPGDWQAAVVQSTFAAFIGALASLIYLMVVFFKNRPSLLTAARYSNYVPLPKKGFVINLFKQSLPFIIVGSAVTVFQLIDQYTYFPIMSHFWNLTDESMMISFARFNANANKIIMIIIPLAGSIAAAALPMLTGIVSTGDKKAIRKQIYNIFRLFFVVMMVSGLGVYGIALPLYTVFYGNSDPNLMTGSRVLQTSAIFAILYGFYSVVSVIVQSINRDDEAIKSLGYGIMIKFAFQVPMIFMFKEFGALLASSIGITFASLYLLRVLYNNYGVNLHDMSHLIITITIISVVVGVSALLVTIVLSRFLPLTRSFQLISLIASTIIGGIIGLIMLLKTRVADDLIDKYLGKFIHLKKTP